MNRLALSAAAASMLLTSGCDEVPPAGRDGEERVEISGEVFWLEPALDDASRFRGLSGRTSIPDDGGMLFVFPDSAQRYFVMRDCPIPIDIAFLDPSARVTAVHEMQPEDPQGENESDAAYEFRLRRYHSRFDAQFVIELRGGRMRELGLEAGDKVELDADGLKARAE